jgi:hypothetical protein
VLSSITPESPEPTLNALAKLSVEPWTPDVGESGDFRLMPSITVTNPTADSWGNVSIAINDMFYYYHGEVLSPGESVTTPCEFFVAGVGNVPFRPGSQQVELISVFAQIPSGERAVFETAWPPAESETP